MYNYMRFYASTMVWNIRHKVNPPPAHAGSREGFISKTFLTNARRGREALK